jgi:hypothetical protein
MRVLSLDTERKAGRQAVLVNVIFFQRAPADEPSS